MSTKNADETTRPGLERAHGYASPHNFASPVRSQMHLPEKVTINDLTLREGRGIDGVVLGIEDVKRIARSLAELGVPMIQLGYNLEELKAIRDLSLGMRTEVLISSPHQHPPYTIQAHRERIDRVMELGLGLDLCFGTSDHLLLARRDLRDGREEVSDLRAKELEAAQAAVKYAKQQGAVVGTNLQDFLRADLDYLLRFCRELAACGVDLITLDDFAGPAIPTVYKYVVEQVKKEVPQTAIGIHVTNDFGLGTAVVLGAFEGGAEVLDVGINNYGERTGHADLGEVAVCVEIFYGKPTGIKLEKLYSTSQAVADVFGVPVPASKPLVGQMAFADVGEVHYLYKTQPWIYRVIPENLVGNRRRVALGDKSGRNAIRARAAEVGLELPETDTDIILKEAISRMRQTKKALTDQDFISMVREMIR